MLAFLAVMLFYLFGYKSGPDLEAEEQAKQKVEELWARPLPWYPSLDSLTTGGKTSPDGVKMPTGWSEL